MTILFESERKEAVKQLTLSNVYQDYTIERPAFLNSFRVNQTTFNCDGGVSFTRDGNITGCVLHDTTSFNWNHQNIQVKIVYFDEQGQMTEALLMQPALFTIHGTHTQRQFFGKLTLDSLGATSKGQLVNAETIMVNGHPVIIPASEYMSFDDQGKFDVKAYYSIKNPTISNHRIQSGNSLGTQVKSLCSDLGYDPDYWRDVAPVFVSAPETFIDETTGELVTKTDENVNVINSLSCSGTFKVQLP